MQANDTRVFMWEHCYDLSVQLYNDKLWKGISFLYGTTNYKSAMLRAKQCDILALFSFSTVPALRPFNSRTQCLFNVQHKIRTLLDAN